MLKEKKATVGSIIISYFSILFTLISGLLYTPWLIKQLGQSDYALYSIGMSLMAYVTIDFGLSAIVSRYIAKYIAEQQEEKIKSFLGIVLKVYLIITVIVFIALISIFFCLTYIYRGLNGVEIKRLRIVYVIMAIMTIFSIPVLPVNGIYTAYGRVYNVKLFDFISKVLIIIFVCVALILGKGLYFVTLINAAVTILINVWKLLYLKKAEKLEVDLSYRDKEVVKGLLSFSSWMAIAMIADKFFFTIEPTLLGAFSNSTEVAIFAVAAQIEGYVLLFADGLNGIFLPQVAQLAIEEDCNTKLTDLMIKVGRLQLLVVGGLFMGIATQGLEFVRLWFGKEYINSYYAVLIMLCPCLIHMTQGIGMETLYIKNMAKYRAFCYLIGALVNVVVTIIVVPYLGALGGAIGIACGFLVGHEIILNIVYSWKAKLKIAKFFRECHLRMVLPLSLSLLMGFVIAKFLPFNGLFGLLIKCACSLIFYLFVTFLFYLKKEEKHELKLKILRRKGK